jgi:multimeric flavodoxin WrbA
VKVVVLNGSPKGELSVSLQYARYLIKRHPDHTYRTFNVSEAIDEIASAPGALATIVSTIEAADLVLWVTPVYCYLVPSQLKRFIELVFASEAARAAFAGTYAAVVTTSSHFYDHTAHRYLNAVCDDLQMSYAGGFSAEMFDLLQPGGREKWDTFARFVLDAAEGREPVARTFSPIEHHPFVYRPGPPDPAAERLPLSGLRAVLVTDSTGPPSNQTRMIERFASSFTGGLEVVDLNDVKIDGGCLGSVVRCGLRHECERDDGFVDFYRTRLMTADLLVFVGSIVDRHLSYKWKEFIDRSLFHGHVPSLSGKQVGWIISGPLRQIPNLRDTIEASVELQMANLVEIVTDEDADSETIDALLSQLARRLLRFAASRYVKPPTFLGVGGMKVCRHIVERNRSLFQADYPFYNKKLGYDLPPPDLASMARNALIPLTRVPAVARFIDRNFKEALVKPFARILEDR